jgi:hypothetical protein
MADLGVPELIEPFRVGPFKGEFRLYRNIDKMMWKVFKTKTEIKNYSQNNKGNAVDLNIINC